MALRSFVGGSLFAEVYGEGPPRVLALHGWARRGSDFGQALSGIPALAPDLPGFGASPAPRAVIGAEGYADIVAEMLPSFDRPPVLVGHSFGGRVAVCLAAKAPDRFQSLVLTGAPLLRLGPQRRPAAAFRIARALNRLGVVSDSRMEQLRRRRGSLDYRSASGVMRDILVTVVNESYEGQLGAIEIPVLFLWGALDSEVPSSMALHAAALINDAASARGSRHSRDLAELIVLEEVGHQLPTEAPEELRRAIVSSLE